MTRYDRACVAVLGALLAGLLPVPLAAQQVPSASVSAAEPEGIVQALRFAGYEAELSTDDQGDPLIDTEFSGYTGSILFYGCSEDTHERCDAVQLRVGLDRAEPMTPDMLYRQFSNDRFYSVSLDDEGDPWFNWDIMTGNGDGIPTSVFLLSVQEFSAQVASAAVAVFTEEQEKDVNFSDPSRRPAETI